jgi:outer membrane lipoprotein SlyB
MRKIILGLVAATVAIPSVASAQPGYDPYYGGSRYAHPADRNGDGVVTEREARRYERQMQRQQSRAYNNGYGSNYGTYGNSYGGAYGNSYGGAYGNSYGGAYGNNNGGNYGQYYDRSGYYSGPTWRGDDGRYYCRRSNGSTGTLVGGGVGAVIGSQVAGRGDGLLGAIVGGAIGAVIGNSVDKNSNRYRCN